MGNSVWIFVICMITYAAGSTDTTENDNELLQENRTTVTPNLHSVCEIVTNQVDLIASPNGPTYDISPASSNELTADVGDAYQKGVSWLLAQRKDDWGWPLVSTATAILSLQLTNDSWYSRGSSDLSAQLSVKQLEIELLADLSRAKVVDKNSSRRIRTLPNIDPGMLAYYIMALNSTCHDVTDFYKNDLVEILTNNMNRFPQTNFNNYFQYGLALLALCQSGAPIKTRYIREILDGQSDDGSYRFGTDVVSMAVMAMACVSDKVPNGYRDEYQRKMNRSIEYILSNQSADSTFGNQISTALAVQALTAAGVQSSNWNCHSAVRTVLVSQETEGHFGSHGGTIQILPLLINKNFASVKDVKPYCDIVQEDEEVDRSDVPEIQITLVIENGVDTSAEILNLNVVAPENATLYEAMLMAAEQHPTTFRFEAQLGQWGHFMSHINGVANDNENYHYWTILIGSERTSASTGSDGVITEDGETYIWYYKSFA